MKAYCSSILRIGMPTVEQFRPKEGIPVVIFQQTVCFFPFHTAGKGIPKVEKTPAVCFPAWQDLMVSPLKANIGSLVVTLPFDILFIALFIIYRRESYSGASLSAIYLKVMLGCLVFIPGIAAHELIHGICWALSNPRRWKAISFGFSTTALAPYCSCSETLTKKQYIVGALMPTIVLGFIPGILSVITGSQIMLYFAILMIIGGGGDFLMTINILKFRPEHREILYYDHPTDIGTVSFYR